MADVALDEEVAGDDVAANCPGCRCENPVAMSAAKPESSRPTMRDVAALAGVALKTVSRVINGVPTVDPELAQRVRNAADKLGYRPNLAASNLRSGRTNIVGLLLEDVGNPFSAALHRSIEDYMRERGVLLLTASLDEDPDRERELASRLIDSRVDGLIIVPASTDHRYLVAEQGHGTSIVFVDREPRPLVADAVVADNRRSAARARGAPGQVPAGVASAISATPSPSRRPASGIRDTWTPTAIWGSARRTALPTMAFAPSRPPRRRP